MTTDERLETLLRATLPKAAEGGGPSRDLWPLILARGRARRRWSWVDLGLAALVALALLTRPDWLSVLVYHL